MRWRLDAAPVASKPLTGRRAGSARLRSDSSGTVRLRSADPAAPPRFESPGLRDPLGPRPDDGAVVDASGSVHGTDRLSVVDASIVPNGPSLPYLTNQAYRENAGALPVPSPGDARS
jgi:hypothetical protein